MLWVIFAMLSIMFIVGVLGYISRLCLGKVILITVARTSDILTSLWFYLLFILIVLIIKY